jgi:hypothetical protein
MLLIAIACPPAPLWSSICIHPADRQSDPHFLQGMDQFRVQPVPRSMCPEPRNPLVPVRPIDDDVCIRSAVIDEEQALATPCPLKK